MLHGISEIKPDRIILIVSKDKDWMEFQRETLSQLKTKLEIPWVRTNALTTEEWESLSDYEKCISYLLKTIKKIKVSDPKAQIFVDITAATRFFNIAAVNAAMLHKNIILLYTPRTVTKSHLDLNFEDRNDWGKESVIIRLPYVPALEKFEKNPFMKSIILALYRMGGKSFSLKNIVANIQNNLKFRGKSDADMLIKLSRYISILEEFGFVRTFRSGRRKVVELTSIGKVLASVFQEQNFLDILKGQKRCKNGK
jgi:DNA-binding MarR family transcriptional regulator